MRDIETKTYENILNASRKEFLANGFRGASLRNIAREAGVTTGAFYGYFKSKEQLFDALVAEPYNMIVKKFREAQDAFSSLPVEEQPKHMADISGSCMDWMVHYIYEHFDTFKLLLCCAEGTRYENFIHSMVEIETQATHRFLSVLRQLGSAAKEIDPKLEHILISGLFSAFFEIVIHDMPEDRAIEYVRELREFYTAGWQKIMGL